jgi:hypothetical protein
MKDAYWITNTGDIIDVPSGSYHYLEVINHPTKFGMTEREIQKIIKPFKGKKFMIVNGENIQLENVIRLPLIKKGYIRLRYRNNVDAYSIECYELNEDVRLYLKNWIQVERIPKNTTLNIIEMKTEDMFVYDSVTKFLKTVKPKEVVKNQDSDWHTKDPVKKELEYKAGTAKKVGGKKVTGGFDTPAEYKDKTVIGDSHKQTVSLLKKLLKD